MNDKETPTIQEIPRVTGALCQEPWEEDQIYMLLF